MQHGGDFKGAVVAGLEFVYAALLDVEAGDTIFFGEFDSQRQADVAEADDGDLGFWGKIHWMLKF